MSATTSENDPLHEAEFKERCDTRLHLQHSGYRSRDFKIVTHLMTFI
jgi:hypothetical protein